MTRATAPATVPAMTAAMTADISSPQVRLAASRKALIRQMGRGDGVGVGDGDDHVDGLAPPGTHHSNAVGFDGAPDDNERSSIFQMATQAVMAWWQHHPAQVAVDIGRPFLRNYARSKPLQLLGIAAGVGAALVLVKPWRLVSITGLAFAALKSTNLPNTLMSLLPRAVSKGSSNATRLPQKDKL